MAKHEHRIGCVIGLGANKTAARESAMARADSALSRIDRTRPQLVTWNGAASMVYPTIGEDGSIVWAYSNPRTIAELAADAGRISMGCGIGYESASHAASAALSHMIQIDPAGIPDEIPSTLAPKDAENLATLRKYQREPIVNPALVA